MGWSTSPPVTSSAPWIPSRSLGSWRRATRRRGGLVPDEITISILESEVSRHPDAKGVIYDGFPRTTAQATALDDFLAKKGTGVSVMLSLVVPEDELRVRLTKRAETSGRVDDADPVVIQNRIDTYNTSTAPVADHYRAQGKLVEIDGVGDIAEVTSRLFGAVDPVAGA